MASNNVKADRRGMARSRFGGADYGRRATLSLDGDVGGRVRTARA